MHDGKVVEKYAVPEVLKEVLSAKEEEKCKSL